MLDAHKDEAEFHNTAEYKQIERNLESLQRNVKDICNAIGEQSIVDGQSVKRLLLNLLPLETK